MLKVCLDKKNWSLPMDESESNMEGLDLKAWKSSFRRESGKFMHVICEAQSKGTSRHLLGSKQEQQQKTLNWMVLKYFANITLITHDFVIESTECDLLNLAQRNQSLRELNTWCLSRWERLVLTCEREWAFSALRRWELSFRRESCRDVHVICEVKSKRTNRQAFDS